MLVPINDVMKVEIANDEFNFGTAEKQGVETGIVVSLPAYTPYFGFHSFSFENSLGDPELIAEILKGYQKLIGKRVYWKSYSERGMVFKEGKKTYAMIKFTDLVAYSDAEDEASSVEIQDGGAFKI